MTWEGERGGFYFRLSLFDIEKLIKSTRACQCLAGAHGYLSRHPATHGPHAKQPMATARAAFVLTFVSGLALGCWIGSRAGQYPSEHAFMV